MKGVIKLTYLDKLKEIDPDFIATRSVDDLERCILGCPHSHGLEENLSCPESSELDYTKYDSCCIACWHREYPEEKEAEPELTYEINLKEEKKMKDLSAVIRNAVLDSISDSDIEEAVGSFFENYDYSDLIESSVREYLESNADDIAEDIVNEAVRSYMIDNL